jgi:hypothetical protein
MMFFYSIPALTMYNEFANLAAVGRYVDLLIASTGDQNYAVVYEWDEDGPSSGRPFIAQLKRVNGAWERVNTH